MLTHVMPYLGYGHEWTCGPERATCCQFDFMRVPPSRWDCFNGQPARLVTESNVRERCARKCSKICVFVLDSRMHSNVTI